MNTTDRIMLEEWEVDAFVGNNAIYYKDMWRENAARAHYKGWNWCGFFFSMEWLAYRKMYKEALIFFLLSCVISFLPQFFPFAFDFMLQLISFVVIRLCVAAFGNSFYRQNAVHVVNEASGMQHNAKLEYIKDAGGVTRAGLIACILLHLALTIADAL